MAPKTTRKKASRKKATRRKTTPAKTNGTAVKAAESAPVGRAPTRQESYSSRRVNGTAGAAPTVHCMLAPMDSEWMLLPTNAIEEVIDYSAPTALPQTPDWFLGQVEWENRQIPVFSYSALITGDDPSAVTPRARIMIIKSLSESARVPYLGIVISDIPRLINVQPDHLEHLGDERSSMGVFSQVNVQEQVAIIPDLERLTHLVTHTAYGALPITQID